MNHYLVRHGDAVSAAENPQRPLSSEGRRRVERAARLTAERRIQVSWIYHSGILRARETAEILAREIVPASGIGPLPGLLPDDDPMGIWAELNDADAPILLVGHLPFLGRLAGLLVQNDPERAVVEFYPATVVCCSRSATLWKISWYITP